MIKVRDARLQDADRICSFKRESAKANFPGCPFNEQMFRRHLLRQIKARPNNVLVAEAGGVVAGYIWFKLVDSTVGAFGRIEHIFVDGKYRKQGIGRELMQSAEDHFRGIGTKKIKLTVTSENEAAVSLYKGIGYETRRLVMEKDL
jgi:ribosomal protein S18 acetylase RimI-like enzyme